MNRKNIIGIIIVLVIFMTSAVVWSFSSKKNLNPSDYSIGIGYSQAIKENKPFVAMFYTDWCTYCKIFMPKYKILSEAYKNKYNFVMIDCDNPENQNLILDYAIGGFPTLYIIDPSINNRILINNALYDNLSKVKIELDRYLRIRSMIQK